MVPIIVFEDVKFHWTDVIPSFLDGSLSENVNMEDP